MPAVTETEMKTIGLLGGMSWESTQTYYRLINEGVRDRLGGLHSAPLVLYSVDFQEIEELQHRGDWEETARILGEAGRRLHDAGADFLVLCTNTMHRVADEIQERAGIPLLHLADATGEAVRAVGLRRVGLLGTRFTMEQEFYRGRLADGFGLDVLVPEEDDRKEVHRVIYDELCRGVIRESSRQRFAQVIRDLVERGAEGVILGCTEIPLLVRPEDSPVPLFDTTAIHAEAAVERALR